MKKIILSLVFLTTLSVFSQDFIYGHHKSSKGSPLTDELKTQKPIPTNINTKEALELLPITDLFISELGHASWDAPDLDINFPLWKQYLIENTSYWGANNGDMDVAIKWDPIQLIGYNGAKITKIKFQLGYCPNASFKIRVYQGEEGEVIYEQEVGSVEYNVWNTVDLDTPVVINTSESVWVGYHVIHNTGEYPAGIGQGVDNPNSDLVRYNESYWGHIQTYYNYSWTMAAYIEMDGNTMQLPQTDYSTSSDGEPSTKSSKSEIQSYQLFIDGNQVGNTTEDIWQFQYLDKGETYTGGVIVDYDDGNSEIVEYEFFYNPPFDLDISPDTIFISNEGSLKDFEIFSNTSWTAEENDWWIDLFYASGNNDKTNTVNVQENTDNEPRIGTVTIDGDFAPSCLLTIIQEGIPIPMPMPTDLIVDNNGDAIWEEPYNPEGYTFIKYKAYLDGTYQGETETLSWSYINLEQFTAYTAGVTAVFEEGESAPIEYEFVFHTVNELEVDKASIIANMEAGDELIEISSNTSWTISCEADTDWLNFSTNEGTGNDIINIHYAYNDGGVRFTDIFIHGLNTPTKKIRLIQAQSSSGGTPPPFNVLANLNEENGEVDVSWEHNPNASGYGFYEDFEDGTADNFIINDDRIAIEEGYLKMQGSGEQSLWIMSQYDEVFSDFLLETTIIRHSGDIGQNSGVIVRASSINPNILNNYGYFFGFSQDGIMGYAILDGSSNPYISDWLTSEDILIGLDVENTLSIHAHGDIIDFYINNKLQYTINDDSYASGYNAIVAYDSWSNMEIWFKDVAVGKENNRKSAFSSFNIYKNNEFISNTVDTFFDDQLTDYGDYQYQVSALFDEGESSLTASNSIHWLEIIPPPNTIVSILPTSQDVGASGLFTTTIEIEDAIDLGHFNLELQFNPSLINALSVSLRNFITSTGRSISNITENINNEFGFIEYAITTSGDGISGAEGQGMLLSIDWEVVNNVTEPTTTSILLKDIEVLKVDSSLLDITTHDNATIYLLPNGIMAQEIAKEISIHPNPNQGLFTIHFNRLKDDTEVFIINSIGALIKQTHIKKTAAQDYSIEIDLSHLQGGIYYIKLVNKGILHSEKVIIY